MCDTFFFYHLMYLICMCVEYFSVCVCLFVSRCCRLESGGAGTAVCNFLCITLALRHYGQACQFMFFSFFSLKMRSKHHTQSRNTQILANCKHMGANIYTHREHIILHIRFPFGCAGGEKQHFFKSPIYLFNPPTLPFVPLGKLCGIM